MKLSRRNFIKAGGATVSLPLFHSLAENKGTEKPDKKLVFMYIPNGIVRRAFFPGEEKREIPTFKGGFSADKIKNSRLINKPGTYPLELTSTLKPLAAVKDDITLITGLDRTFMDGQDVHAQGSASYLTSISPEQAAKRGLIHPNGRTLDHVIADKVGHKTAFKTLEISCNGFKTGKESPEFDNISWYDYHRVAPSIKDPRKLYNRLFKSSNYSQHVNDVTDLILEDAKSISKKLGREDQQKFAKFTHDIRSIELRMQRLERILKSSNVKEPTDADLPRGEYIRLMGDLMISALQMGITNICTFMIGPERWNAPMMYEGVFDKAVSHHNLTHNQKGDGWLNVQKIDIFHIQQYAYVISRMKQIKEADGSSLLDNSIVAYGAGLGDGATHQFFDLPMIVAGRCQGQIKQGRLIKCKSGTLNSNLWLTFAQQMGLEIDSYADSTGTISMG